MPLTTAQKNFIVMIDRDAKEILKNGGQEALLLSLGSKMHEIKDIMDCSSQNELNHYCEQYDGFYQYMKLLELLAQGCKEGIFNDI